MHAVPAFWRVPINPNEANAAAKELVQQITEAWLARNPKGFAACFTPGGTLVGPTAHCYRGREAIEDAIEKIMTTNAGTFYSFRNVQIHHEVPGVAAITWEGMTRTFEQPEGHRWISSGVAALTGQGTWLFVSGHLGTPIPRRPRLVDVLATWLPLRRQGKKR